MMRENHTAASLTINNIFVKEFCVFIKAGAQVPGTWWKWKKPT
jgi:hypothetical protein